MLALSLPHGQFQRLTETEIMSRNFGNVAKEFSVLRFATFLFEGEFLECHL